MSPPALDRVVRTCLAKDPEERWQSAADVKRELRWIGEGSLLGVPTPVVSRRRPWRLLPWIGLAIMSAIAAWLALAGRPRAAAPQTAFRSSILLPAKVRFQSSAISPDGTRLVVAGEDEGGISRLWLRRLDGFKSEPLAGNGARGAPLLVARRPLHRVLRGRQAQAHRAIGWDLPCARTIRNGVGGAWSPGGDVLFAEPSGPLYRLSSAGGKAVTGHEARRGPPRDEPPLSLLSARWTALPLHGVEPRRQSERRAEPALCRLARWDARRALMPLSTNARYSQGYLLFMRGGVSSGSLLAQAFDPERFEIRGEPLLVAEAISGNLGYFNFGSFTVSSNRRARVRQHSALDAAPVAGPGGQAPVGLHGGRPIRIPEDLSRWLACRVRGVRQRDQQGSDLDRRCGPRHADASDGGTRRKRGAVWSPDGARIVFSSDRSHQDDLIVRASSGSTADEALSNEPGQKIPLDWSRDGRFLLYFDRPASGTRVGRLSALPMSGDRKSFVLYPSTIDGKWMAAFSPDGRWVVFATDEAGRTEVCAVSFPDGKRKIQISNAGGDSPRWRADGREILYSGPGRSLMAVDVQTGDDLKPGVPRRLFDFPGVIRGWDVTPDGQRFLVNVPVVESNAMPLNLVVNWTARLKRIEEIKRDDSHPRRSPGSLRDPVASRRGRDGDESVQGEGHAVSSARSR